MEALTPQDPPGGVTQGGGLRELEVAGLAHVATVSFLASRAIPSVGFWMALAGGAALARAGARRGLRWGYGASLAAMLQTVAIIGPARFTVPLTQALTAPLLGALEARGAPAAWQMLVCGAIRLAQNALTAAFVIVVLTGVDAYTEVVRPLRGPDAAGARGRDRRPRRDGRGAGRRGRCSRAPCRCWSTVAACTRGRRARTRCTSTSRRGAGAPVARARFDPRAVTLAAAVAFGVLLASVSWGVLAAVAAWLRWPPLTCRGDRDVVPTGVALALMLFAVVFVGTALGGLGMEEALARAARAGLLVAVATWLRAAAGASGLREVSQRGLGRLGRLPSAREASFVMNDLGTGRELVPAARSVVDALRTVERRPIPVLDAVLGWVAAEARRFRPGSAAPPMTLRARPADLALVLLAAAPLAVLLGG